MSDPFDALRTPVVPLAPDPAFAARLRRRVEQALDIKEGATMSDLGHAEPATADQAAPAEPTRHGDIVYVSLWVPDADRAADFFGAVVGWTFAPVTAPGHARQVTGTSLHHGIAGGEARSTLMLCFAVDDLDAALERVRAAGGRAGPPADEPHGRVADCTDDEGTRFALYQLEPDGDTPRPAANGSRHGDISYITMQVRRSDTTRAFYGAVLGWRFSPGRVDDGWGVDDVVPMTGLHGGHDEVTVVPMYRVDDIDAAVERVRAAGGRSTPVEQQPYGLSALCSDDQGTAFYLGQH